MCILQMEPGFLFLSGEVADFISDPVRITVLL